MAEGGTVHITANGAVLSSGKPIRCFGYRIQSNAQGPGTVTLYNSTSALASAQSFQATGVINGSAAGTFGAGIKFPNGLFATIDSSVSYLELDVLQEQS